MYYLLNVLILDRERQKDKQNNTNSQKKEERRAKILLCFIEQDFL